MEGDERSDQNRQSNHSTRGRLLHPHPDEGPLCVDDDDLHVWYGIDRFGRICSDVAGLGSRPVCMAVAMEHRDHLNDDLLLENVVARCPQLVPIHAGPLDDNGCDDEGERPHDPGREHIGDAVSCALEPTLPRIRRPRPGADVLQVLVRFDVPDHADDVRLLRDAGSNESHDRQVESRSPEE